MKKNSKLFVLLFGATLSAFGPFMTDFYLPAFPGLKDYFETTASLVQASLTFGMIGLAVGQLLIGPLSDRYGRRKPLLLSMTLFVLATAACLGAWDIGSFIFFRLLQGIAGAGGVVISKSIAVDLYQGKTFTRFFALLSAVQGLAPIGAPVIGGVLLSITDWKGIFCVLLVLGVCLWVATLRFRESLPLHRRATGRLRTTFSHFIPIMRHRQFMVYVLILSLAMGAMFAYISASPFIFQTCYGLTPVAYSLCFAVNALGILLGSLLPALFQKEQKALRVGVRLFLAMSILTAAILIGHQSVFLVEMACFFLLFSLGMILPLGTTLALNLERQNSGNASAMLGFLQFLFAGLVAPLVGIGDMRVATGCLLLLCSLGIFFLEHRSTRTKSVF